MSRQPEQGQWVIASIYSGEIAPETARYADLAEAGQTLMELVQQGRLQEGDYEVRPAPTTDGPSLRSVVGICPRPAGVSPEADQTFLHDIRYGDDDL